MNRRFLAVSSRSPIIVSLVGISSLSNLQRLADYAEHHFGQALTRFVMSPTSRRQSLFVSDVATDDPFALLLSSGQITITADPECPDDLTIAIADASDPHALARLLTIAKTHPPTPTTEGILIMDATTGHKTRAEHIAAYSGLSLNALAAAISDWRARKGFVTDATNIPEKLMLIVTEVSEAMEDHRDGKVFTVETGDGKPCGLASELADVMIRVFDLAGALGIDLEHEIAVKMAYNETRPFKHGRNC